MTSRPYKALLFLFISILLLAACQTNNSLPTITFQQTQTALTPQVLKENPEKQFTPTFTPSPVPTATLPAHLTLSQSALKGTEVVFWHPWPREMAAITNEMAAEFNQKNEWGVTVRVESFYNSASLFEAVNERLSQPDSTLPHVVAASMDHLSVWAERKEAVVFLDEYINLEEYGLSQQEIASYHPVFWQQDQSNQRQLAIPALRSARVIFYNQSWAKELGFPAAPTNAVEFNQQACAAAIYNNSLRNRDKHGTGGFLASTDSLTTLSWMRAFDADIITSKEGQSYQFVSPETEETLLYLRKMFDDGCSWVGRNPAPYDYFSSRMALFYSGTLSDLFVQKQHNTFINNEDEWIILPFFGKNGKQVVYASGYSYAALRSTPEAQMAAWLFIRWMAQPKNIARLAEVLPSIPVSSAVEAQVVDYRMNFPWKSILPLKEYVYPVPGLSSWRIVRRLLEDAAWQMYHLPADQLTFVLPQLESAVKEFVPETP
jgi:multiple sugar transport system substrate-binding protein